jgi:hypothetical protein
MTALMSEKLGHMAVAAADVVEVANVPGLDAAFLIDVSV